MEIVVGAVAAGIEPTETSSGSVVLRQGKRYVTLVKPDGTKTQSGAWYEQRSRNELPAGGAFNRNQQPQREGLTELIKTRDGREKVVRRWDPVTNEFKFTALGRSFYARKRSVYVVHVPVIVEGRRKNGTTYELKSFMPVEKMGLQGLTLPQTLTQ